MTVNRQLSVRKKQRRHENIDNRHEDSGPRNDGGSSLLENHYEIYEDTKQVTRSKLKQQLLNSLQQTDEDEFPLDEIPVDFTPQPQKNGDKKIDNLTEEQTEKIKQIYRDRNKVMKDLVMLELKEAGVEASLKLDEQVRYPLLFPDIEELLSHLQYNRLLTRWLHVKRGTKLRNSIVLCVEGPGMDEFMSQVEDCPSLNSFKVAVEFISPLTYGDSVEYIFASKLDFKPPSKLPVKQGFERIKLSSNKGKGVFVSGHDTQFNIRWKTDKPDGDKMSDGEYKHSYKSCVKTKQTLPVSLYSQDNFSRLEILMSPVEMANEKYPLPIFPRFRGFVHTKQQYEEVTEKSPMFGVDCEMCETTAGSELTRISIVNELHEVVYERLVKPHNRIVNYVTKYSGINAKMLAGVQTRLSDVQSELRVLLPPDAILVGQSLNCDLIAMKMMHPYVIDTSMIFNLSGRRQQKTKLKTLCSEFLSEKIQENKNKGHNSIEDACAALKLVQAKLARSLVWGDAVLGYVRKEEESRLANKLLREKDAMMENVELKLAVNALVDDLSKFVGATHQNFITREESECGVKQTKRKREDSELCQDNTEKDVKEESCAAEQVCENYIYSQVTVIGSKEVKKRYKAQLSESAQQRVSFIKARSSKDVMTKLLDLNSQVDKRRLILVHLKSPCVCQVEKWTSKLKTEAKENDLVCVSLCGSEGAQDARGAFFTTLPHLDNLPPVKQLVHDYLRSCGHDLD